MHRFSTTCLLAPAVALAFLSGCATGYSVALKPSPSSIQCSDETELRPLPIPLSEKAVLHYLIVPFGYGSRDISDRPLLIVLNVRTRGSSISLPLDAISIRRPETAVWLPADLIDATVIDRRDGRSLINYSAEFPFKRNEVSTFDVRITSGLHGCPTVDIHYETGGGLFTRSELGR